MTDLPDHAQTFGFHPRRYGAINGFGLWTLVVREVRRFMKVSVQTVFAPVVSTLLFMAVFAIALGQDRASPLAGVSFVDFLAPGLTMMAILNNAFANTSSSLIVAKIQGNTVDFLMPPLSAAELNIGFLVGGLVRGLAVGVVSVVVIGVLGFADVGVANPALVVYHAVMSSLILGAVGLLGGIWSEKFDHLAAVQNFVITPLVFLSGTFYAVALLPEPFHALSLMNPLFYMIDGFRAGFVGVAEGNLAVGAVYVGVLAAVLCTASHMVLASGYKLRN
jgi:ABC-2 type transport system permease protein